MNQIILASHGGLAAGAKDTLEMVLGDVSNVHVVSLARDDKEPITNKVEALIATFNADYTISGTGTNWGAPSYQCIVEEGSTDIHAALEDTMHRIIDARAATGDAVDVLRETMGAMPAASVGEDDGVSPIDLDLGYVLPGAVTSFAERAQACDPSDPLNMTDTAGSGLSK